VPSFQEISGKSKNLDGNETGVIKRRETGATYYKNAMQSHGLPGKIPTSFTTVGKPFFENLQYNTPIEIYDDNTVDEMVKIMNNSGAAAINNQRTDDTSRAENRENYSKAIDEKENGICSNLGWTVRSCSKTFVKTNPSLAGSSDM